MNERASLFGQVLRLTISTLLVNSLAMQASAQWLPDRQYAEGPGIAVGELELHPGVAVRGGYDNNVFKSDGEEQPKTSAAILAVTPHLFLTTETSQRASQGEDKIGSPRFIGFRGGIATTYFHYFTDNAPRNLAIDTDFALSIAQGRPVELAVSAGYVRSVTPFTENAGSRSAYVFDTVDPTLKLKFRSRSGVLSGSVGYAPRYVHYESSVFNYLNNIQHGIDVGTAWRFLPSTALIYDARFALQDYLKLDAQTEQLLLFANNQSFRTRLGLNGALTNHITLRLLAGYAAGFYENSSLDEYETGVGEAVFSYVFGPHSWDVGYQRDVASSPLGAWMQIDRGFTKLGLLLANRFSIGLEAGVAHANYGSLLRAVDMADDSDNDPNDGVTGIGVGGDRSRDDMRVDGALRTEYRATNWLAFMVDLTVQSVMTDFDYELSRTQGNIIRDPADYTAMQVFGGVRAHY